MAGRATPWTARAVASAQYRIFGAPMATALISSDSVKGVRGSLAQALSRAAHNASPRKACPRFMKCRPWGRSRQVVFWTASTHSAFPLTTPPRRRLNAIAGGAVRGGPNPVRHPSLGLVVVVTRAMVIGVTLSRFVDCVAYMAWRVAILDGVHSAHMGVVRFAARTVVRA